MRQSTGKSDFFSMISTTKSGSGGALLYSRTLQVSFWNIET